MHTVHCYNLQPRLRRLLAALLVAVALLGLPACDAVSSWFEPLSYADSATLETIPEYSGEPYVVLDGNVPDLTEADAEGLDESYAPLDYLNRCGAAMAVVTQDTMPTPDEERESISNVRPTGWQTVRYDDLVDGRYLYNRCHLLGWQLTAENANEGNLVTGTRYMNTEGMLPFENAIADYVRDGGEVLYRATPIFEGDELVCRGVHLEARSLGDDGRGLSFNVFCYNVQPGIEIDYVTGDSQRAAAPYGQDEETEFVLNTSSRRFHLPTCSSVEQISPDNRQDFTGTRDELLTRGYSPCGSCNP